MSTKRTRNSAVTVTAIAPVTEAVNTEVISIETTETVKPEPVAPIVEMVKIAFRVTQQGKNPFVMQHEVMSDAKNVTTTGLARKTAYAIADSLHKLCALSLAQREQYGYYLTSFRPKAVFTVEIAVNETVRFVAMNTKGIDAVRMVNAKGLVTRSELVHKFELLAQVSQASQMFKAGLQLEAEAENLLLQVTA